MTQGNIVIRFSAENQEVVRQALQQLGKDGEKALAQLSAASQPTSRGMGALSAVMGDLRGVATGFAFSLGPIGTGLIALGPAGLAAAAAVGGAMAAFAKAAEVSDQFVERLKRLKETSDTTGLSVAQIKALGTAATTAGVEYEKLTGFLERFTVSVEELRHGSGNLLDTLLRIDPELVRQMARAKDTAAALDILGKAYERAGSLGQRNELDKAIGGRGQIGTGSQVLEQIAKSGGLDAITQQAKATGNAIDSELVARTIKLKLEIDAIKSRTDNLWGAALSPTVLEAQKQSALLWERMAKAITQIDTSSGKPQGYVAGWWKFSGDETGGVFNKLRGRRDVTDGPADGINPFSMGARTKLPRIGPWTATVDDEDITETELRLERERVAILGEAITPTEQLTLKILELAAAKKKNKDITEEDIARAKASNELARDRAVLSTRTQLGVADQAEMTYQALRDLRDAEAKGFIQDAEEFAAAFKLKLKEIEETSNAMKVRASDTPALTKLSIDADRLKYSLDEGLAGALRGTTSDMLDMAKGTKTVGEAMQSMAQRIADAVAQALLMKAVVKPIADSFSTGLSSFLGTPLGPSGIGDGGTTTLFPSARGNVFSRGALMPFARGGVISRPTIFPMANGAGLMGEAGPEAVMPLRRLGNGRLGVSTEGATPQVNFITQVVNNHPTAQVTQRDEDDGGGGRRSVIVIDEMVAQAAAQPRSQIARALGSQRTMVRR